MIGLFKDRLDVSTILREQPLGLLSTDHSAMTFRRRGWKAVWGGGGGVVVVIVLGGLLFAK